MHASGSGGRVRSFFLKFMLLLLNFLVQGAGGRFSGKSLQSATALVVFMLAGRTGKRADFFISLFPHSIFWGGEAGGRAIVGSLQSVATLLNACQRVDWVSTLKNVFN